MIKFSDAENKTDNIETPDTTCYKDIKSNKEISDNEVHSFWSYIFSGEENSEYFDFTEDELEIISEIYDRDEDEFEFDFDISDTSLQEVLDKFKEEDWNTLDETQKAEVVETFVNTLCEKLDIENQPKLVFFDGDESNCGAFNFKTNEISINRNLLSDPKELVDTIAHESRHAYQYQRGCIGETRMDQLYKFNFEHYIFPEEKDGHYLNYNEYSDQLIEAEARAFASLFYEDRV